MVLAEALRARLLAALRPWLAADPAELRVEPGLLARSRAVARGVELDAAALNAAAGAGRSASWPATFDRAAAAEVELAASPWSAPAVDAVVRGVDVALTLREPAPKKQRPDFKEWVSKEKKRVLASLDPQFIESMRLEVLKSDLGNVKYSEEFIGRLASFYKNDIKGSTIELIEHIAQRDKVDSHVELSVEMQLDLESAYIIFTASRDVLFTNPAVFINSSIENASRLALVCHFKDNVDAIVPGQQSVSVFLRHFPFDDNVSHDQNMVSICLVKEGVFSTIPISISLHESGIFAWRTRVSPVKDLRSFSGPFVVVKVSHYSEEGLSLSVQPLLRVYNKSDFPLELRFQRPNKTNEEAAFVTVRSGDMVDESIGVFDAMDLSGGSKRALMSLALGKRSDGMVTDGIKGDPINDGKLKQFASVDVVQETTSFVLHFSKPPKVPEISNSAVELNGVLLNHALVTFRELLLKCAQHYSWYVLRAIYVTKGSSLLPPSFASIFDDSASSVLDVFFDPSDGSLNVPGLTIGMFKFISKNMKSGGFSGTKRYLGDLGKTVKTASSNALFAAVTEISDSVVRGAETNGLNGMVTGFHQGILRLAMEPSVLGHAIMEGGPDRKIKLDHSAGLDELYIEGYLQAMLDVMYKQEYLRVRVIDDQVILKNLPPNSALINEIVDNVKSFLVSKALLKGDSSTVRPLRHLRNEREWRIAPTVLTLCEHLFVSFAVRVLHREASKAIAGVMARAKKPTTGEGESEGDSSSSGGGVLSKRSRVWTVGRFAVSGMVAYVDGRLCRHIPNPIARRIVSGFLLSFIESRGNE
nr:unnamed protein product [Digitaria exilis]